MQASTSEDCAGRTVHPGRLRWRGLSLDAGERLAYVEAEAGVERERAIVKGGLHQPDAGGAALCCAVHDGPHEAATDARVLRGGIDGDGTDAGDDGALIEHIAADDAAIDLGDDRVEAGSRKHICEQADGGLRAGQIGGEIVRRVEGGEGLVADLAAGGAVLGRGWTDAHFRLGFRWHGGVSRSCVRV